MRNLLKMRRRTIKETSGIRFAVNLLITMLCFVIPIVVMRANTCVAIQCPDLQNYFESIFYDYPIIGVMAISATITGLLKLIEMGLFCANWMQRISDHTCDEWLAIGWTMISCWSAVCIDYYAKKHPGKSVPYTYFNDIDEFYPIAWNAACVISFFVAMLAAVNVLLSWQSASVKHQTGDIVLPIVMGPGCAYLILPTHFTAAIGVAALASQQNIINEQTLAARKVGDYLFGKTVLTPAQQQQPDNNNAALAPKLPPPRAKGAAALQNEAAAMLDPAEMARMEAGILHIHGVPQGEAARSPTARPECAINSVIQLSHHYQLYDNFEDAVLTRPRRPRQKVAAQAQAKQPPQVPPGDPTLARTASKVAVVEERQQQQQQKTIAVDEQQRTDKSSAKRLLPESVSLQQIPNNSAPVWKTPTKSRSAIGEKRLPNKNLLPTSTNPALKACAANKAAAVAIPDDSKQHQKTSEDVSSSSQAALPENQPGGGHRYKHTEIPARNSYSFSGGNVNKSTSTKNKQLQNKPEPSFSENLVSKGGGAAKKAITTAKIAKQHVPQSTLELSSSKVKEVH